jgi:hypothetical protein
MTSSKSNNRKRRNTFRKRNRDYAAEYARRIALAESRGLSRSVGRGHARAGERPRPPGLQLIDPKMPDERAIRAMSRGATLRAAAKAEGLTEESVRRYLKENTQAKRTGGAWSITDLRPRQYPFYSGGRLVSPWLSPEESSRAAKFMQAVQAYLPSGEEGVLEAFAGAGVTDIYGHRHPFEADPDKLYELDHAGELNFPEIYKIVSEG